MANETIRQAAIMTGHCGLRYKEVNVTSSGDLAMQVNDKAPQFNLPDQNGNAVSLKNLQGKTVVLFFFPKADTPG
jgi:peroxiredoxin